MRKLYIWLFLLIGVALFFIFAASFAWADVWRIVTTGNPRFIAIYLAASFAILVLHALRWQTVMQAKGFVVPYPNILGYQFARQSVNFVTPGPKIAGDAVRAGLLSRHKPEGKRIGASRALSTVLLDRAVELQTFAVLFFLMMLWFAFFGELPPTMKYTLIGLATLLLFLVLAFGYSVARGKPFLLRVLRKIGLNKNFQKEIGHFEEAIVSFYRRDRTHFAAAHMIAAVAWFLSFVEYKYLLLLLGINMGLYGVFIVYSFIGLAYMVPVPLALGALETGQAAAFTLLGLAPLTGIALALITRMRDIIFTLIGFGVLLYYGIVPQRIKTAVR